MLVDSGVYRMLSAPKEIIPEGPKAEQFVELIDRLRRMPGPKKLAVALTPAVERPASVPPTQAEVEEFEYRKRAVLAEAEAAGMREE
jgi:hypothetical protein